MAVKIICCYAREDEVLLNKLKAHLRPLEREGLIELWHDRDISAGTEWEREISRRLNEAEIILLLVSPDFVNSDYCYGIEMKRAIERHQRGEARVIPLIIRHVYWQGEPLGKLQALPTDAKPVTSAHWHTLDEAFFDVVRGIRALLTPTTQTNQEIKGQQQEATEQTLPAQPQRQTINTDEAVKLFHHLMQPHSQMRILCLVGDSKMGKSHLLTKVFPSLNQQEYQARYAILDLRNEIDTIPDLLHLACSQLDPQGFDSYHSAHDQWTARSGINLQHITSIFLHLIIHNWENTQATRARNYHLTAQFVKDLSQQSNAPLLLLFDSVESATEGKQCWLMHSLLPQLTPLEHIRVVVAGRSLPAIHGSYAARCQIYRLGPVIDDSAYIIYCQKLSATLGEQSIRDIARLCDYTPGLFADLVVPRFILRR